MSNFQIYDILLSLNVVLILANNADPGEMQRFAAFHLAIFCLQKYLFRSFQYTKGYKSYQYHELLNFIADTMI